MIKGGKTSFFIGKMYFSLTWSVIYLVLVNMMYLLFWIQFKLMRAENHTHCFAAFFIGPTSNPLFLKAKRRKLKPKLTVLFFFFLSIHHCHNHQWKLYLCKRGSPSYFPGQLEAKSFLTHKAFLICKTSDIKEKWFIIECFGDTSQCGTHALKWRFLPMLKGQKVTS